MADTIDDGGRHRQTVEDMDRGKEKKGGEEDKKYNICPVLQTKHIPDYHQPVSV